MHSQILFPSLLITFQKATLTYCSLFKDASCTHALINCNDPVYTGVDIDKLKPRNHKMSGKVSAYKSSLL